MPALSRPATATGTRRRPGLVARRGDLPDLSAQLPGFQRRRHRRPEGHHRPAALHRLARRRRDLDIALLQVADEGFRLRRHGLLRRRSDVRHARRFRRACRRGASARPARDDRRGAFAHRRRPSLVQGEPRQPQQPEIRLVRLGGRQAGRHAAQQLAVDLRRLGLAVGHAPAAVLSAQFPRRAAGPQLPQPAGPGCVCST